MRFFTFLILLLSVNAWAGIAGTTVNLTANQFDTVCNNGVIERKFKGVCPGSWTAGSLPVQGGGSGGSGSSGGLLALSDLSYAGAFRVDGNQHGPSGFDQLVYQSKVILGFNSTTSNLLITGLGESSTKNVGEFDIPTLSTSSNLSDLPIAANTQEFVDLLGQLPLLTPDIDDVNGTTIYGLYEYNNNLLFNFARYYDNADGGSNTIANQVLGIKAVADNLSLTGNVSGAYEYTAQNRAAGWISAIPQEWQAPLGGSHIAGWSSGPTRAIVSRLSVGPSAHVFDIADVISRPANGSVITTNAVLDYPYPNGYGISNTANADAELQAAGAEWNFISETNYCFIPASTSTYLCVGSDGGFESGVSYKLRDNTTGVDTGDWDANDANDYRNMVYMYDVADMVRVRSGEIEPYQVAPYFQGEFSVPFAGNEQTLKRISGATYDPVTRRLYIALLYADNTQGQVSAQPLIVAFNVGGAN